MVPVSETTDFPWAQGGLSDIESEVMGYLESLAAQDAAIGREVLKTPWLAEGVDEGERRLLCLAVGSAEVTTAYAIILTNAPSTSLPHCP